jgi:hypothetical protein
MLNVQRKIIYHPPKELNKKKRMPNKNINKPTNKTGQTNKNERKQYRQQIYGVC